MADQLTMLYRAPGPKVIEGHAVETMTTTDVAAALKDGWHRTIDEAVAPPKRKPRASKK